MDYSKSAEKVLEHIGGKDNVEGAAHCATRLRIVVKDNSKVDIKAIENVEGVKGAFVNGGQIQVIFGVGAVNEAYKFFIKEAGIQDMSLSDVKNETEKKMNPFQKFIKMISDIFVPIIPALLSTALLMGINNILTQKGMFIQGKSLLEAYPGIAGFAGMINLMSTAAFTFLPILISYSATKRFGGTPILGLVLGCIMVHPDLANAYSVGSGSLTPKTWSLFGLTVSQVGYQGAVIPSILGAWILANIEKRANKIIPESLRLFFVPLITIMLSGFAMFLVLGPIGREMGNGITWAVTTMYETFGALGAAVFSALHQAIVVTGIHHTFQAVEMQLLSERGFDPLQPFFSVAAAAQGGAVLGVLIARKNDTKFKQLGSTAFVSALLGITEPAIFGVTLRYRWPFICGAIAAGVGGAYMYIAGVKAIGMGATVIPGLALIDVGGHLQYIIGNVLAVVLGAVLVLAYYKTKKPSWE